MWRFPSSPTLHQPLLTISLLYGRWSTSGSDRGNAHFFTATSNTIEGTGEKRTNEQTLGVNSIAEGELCNTEFPVCICRLTLAWILAKNSTTLLGMPTYPDRSSSLSLDPISCRPASLLQCPVSTASLRRPSPTALFQLLFPNSLLVSLYHFRSRWDLKSKTLCLVSRQNRQRNRLLGGPPT